MAQDASSANYLHESAYADDRVQILNDCNTFGIFSRSGDIFPGARKAQGIFHEDTRYINHLELRLENLPFILLSSNIKEENEILSVDLTNPKLKLKSGTVVPEETLHVRRSQIVMAEKFHERIELENYGDITHTVKLSILINGDFSDIFEVRGAKRAKRGTLNKPEVRGQNQLLINYTGLDNVMRTTVLTSEIDFTFDKKESILYYDLTLEPQNPVYLNFSIHFIKGEVEKEIKKPKAFHVVKEELMPDIESTKSLFPDIFSSNERFTHWINRSKTDLASLLAETPHGKYPYAGVPWYNTAFGRDGIITALQVLWVAPQVAKDVLKFLAAHQSTIEDAEADAEPGKILHETRGGEMSALNEVPFKKYYGTIDATPLFVMLAGAYYSRTGDLQTIRSIWSNIEAALEWVDKYGDLDGDGFVEYKHKAKNGLTNQGWKDSYDSIFYKDGELAEPPIALCEVQGYVFAAKIQASKMALHLGKSELFLKWKKEARQLKMDFNRAFWDKEMNCYILALDGNKKPCRVKSSNAGQVLYTGIADDSKAKLVAKSMTAEDMYSGWGVRTISSKEARYNPLSYHNGSVWPHDVAMIAAGMARYGCRLEAVKLLTGLFDASHFIQLQRLPELFCGLERREREGPTSYPVACSPQAWAVGAVFMLLEALLQIKIRPEKKEISFFKPILPDYIKFINISGLAVQKFKIDLEITNYEEEEMFSVNWKNQPPDWKLVVIK
ncbi:amylo-alpha-1,6-glucosidase [Litoribacter ruber]|uniref:amylo-alpha-1,6-glucosidase n=1 Tax=Litoribacter ruber TaxID=702568 RepID=UPI001BD93631|nr:amylo-alpha-1,6-glucosidase [Litoribacter ruber]MBT0811737.1 amylo-alpha-1,6-glucosidase [Litoribacter ruber]